MAAAFPTGAEWLRAHVREWYWFDEGMSVQEKASAWQIGKHYAAFLYRPNDMDPTSWTVKLEHKSLKNFNLPIMDIVLPQQGSALVDIVTHATVLEIEVKTAAQKSGAPSRTHKLRFVCESADDAICWATSISATVKYVRRWVAAEHTREELAARALAGHLRERALRDPLLLQKEDQTFADIDVDGDGVITRREFSSFFESKASAALRDVVRGCATPGAAAAHSPFGGLLGRNAASVKQMTGTRVASLGADGGSAASNIAAAAASAAHSGGSDVSDTGAAKKRSGWGCVVALYLVALHAICLVLLAVTIRSVLAQVAPRPTGTCPAVPTALPAAWDWAGGLGAPLSAAERSRTLSGGDVTFLQLERAWVAACPGECSFMYRYI
jgi:hypothetical protein